MEIGSKMPYLTNIHITLDVGACLLPFLLVGLALLLWRME